MIDGFDGFAAAEGLPRGERAIAAELVEIYDAHLAANAEKGRYYDQMVTAGECNLGIALPSGLNDFEMACCWPEKAVTALADRSRFDGFVNANGESMPELDDIVRDNRLVSAYGMAVIDELKHGGILVTLAANQAQGCLVRFHTFETSAARWNGVLQRIDAAIAIVDSKKSDEDWRYRPALVNLYTDDATWVIQRVDNKWHARRAENGLGRCMATVMRNQPTNGQPLGTSRITRSVRALTRGYIRTMTLATIGLEFSTSPQKYLMGVSDAQYDALINEKFARYIDSIMLGTVDPDTGQIPQYGQLAQGTLQPHVDMLRMLSTQYAAATCLSVTDAGVVNDANPTSSDAINAQNDKLVRRAELKSLVSLKQSKKPWLTRIEGPVEFDRWLEAESGDLILCDIDGEKKAPVLDRRTTLLIGPEGGFSPREIEMVKSYRQGKTSLLNLGNTRLRARTAAIIALGCLLYHI